MANVQQSEKKTVQPEEPANGSKALSKAEKALTLEQQVQALENLPEGEDWQVDDTGEERVYWHKGSAIKGLAIGLDEWKMDDDSDEEDRLYIKVKLTAPAMVVRKGEALLIRQGKMKPTIAPVGTIVHMGITHRLMALYRDVVTSAYVLEIYARPTTQVDIGKGQTVWNMAIAKRRTKMQKVLIPVVEREGSAPPF